MSAPEPPAMESIEQALREAALALMLQIRDAAEREWLIQIPKRQDLEDLAGICVHFGHGETWAQTALALRRIDTAQRAFRGNEKMMLETTRR